MMDWMTHIKRPPLGNKIKIITTTNPAARCKKNEGESLNVNANKSSSLITLITVSWQQRVRNRRFSPFLKLNKFNLGLWGWAPGGVWAMTDGSSFEFLPVEEEAAVHCLLVPQGILNVETKPTLHLTIFSLCVRQQNYRFLLLPCNY